jgi:hypothetical protein
VTTSASERAVPSSPARSSPGWTTPAATSSKSPSRPARGLESEP